MNIKRTGFKCYRTNDNILFIEKRIDKKYELNVNFYFVSAIEYDQLRNK